MLVDNGIEKASKQLSSLCDVVIEEENCVTTLEQDVEQWKGLLVESENEDEMVQDIKESRNNLNSTLHILQEQQECYEQRQEPFNNPKFLSKNEKMIVK